jgi:DNA-binding CsgD family transcriptional regulator/tetratricopeptide (TPR) repeat protein
MVGRVDELAELELALAEAEARRPVLVLLGGDSGVGKTRLIGELEQRVAGRDTVVLRGEGVEQGDSELPYAPLLGALRPLVREHHPVLDSLSAGSAAQLSALLPGFGDGSAADNHHDGSSQLRLFEALLELLDLLSCSAPLVLILEDMHWADRSTRTFVSFLVRSLRDERVMLVLSYRTDELHRRHPLRPLLSELERLERARRIDLAPFDRAELTEALTDILGDLPSEPLVQRLFARSEGNPLYTEELLAAGLDGRGAAPQSLRDAFMLRIERLSPDAQRAARVIAVGRRLAEPTIAEVSGIEHEALHEALREAVAEQVLVADEDGDLLFRHALLREAVYDDLLPGERGELHLALARAFEQRCTENLDREAVLAAAIASHYAAAGDQPAALRATIEAALAARNVSAYGDQADLAERALELWPRVASASEIVSLDHVDLLGLAAAGHGASGGAARAEVLLSNALQELDCEQDPRRYSGVLGRLARIQWALNRGLEGLETAQRALSMLPAEEPSRERASLLAWLARTRFLRGRVRDALVAGEEALAVAIAAGAVHTQGEVLNTLGMAQMAVGREQEGVASLREAIDIARRNDDIDGLIIAYGNLADLLHLRGRTRDALEIAREGLAAAPRPLGRHAWLMLTASQLETEIGDWPAARTHMGPPRWQLVGNTLIFCLLREAEVAIGEGNDEIATERLEEAESLVASSSESQWIGLYGALLGELRRRQYDLEGARAAVASALDRLELCTDDVSRIARVTAVGTRVEADLALRAHDLREAAQEKDAVARLRIHVRRLKAAAQEGGPVERAWRAIGDAELARARRRNDPGLWLKAAVEWDAIERPYSAAGARWRAAEAFVEAGDREGAREQAGLALATASRLGARWLAEEVQALVDRARVDVSGGASEPAAPSTETDPFGLTPRERQVLALVAEGATNRQIGAALFMAEKTASVHVSRILGKLGVSSRTQAAAVAHRLHLTAGV